MRTDAEIESLVRAFEECTLPAAEWTHREHMTIALWYLRHQSLIVDALICARTLPSLLLAAGR